MHPNAPARNGYRAPPRRYARLASAWLAAWTLGELSGVGHASELAREPSDKARFYSTPEERRAAGERHLITENLSLAALLEAESSYTWRRRTGGGLPGSHDQGLAMQLGLAFKPSTATELEVIYELDATHGKHRLDEALITLAHDTLELEFGYYNLPFGEYHSRFVSGPLLEFGETRGLAGTLSYRVAEDVDVAAYVYRGKARAAKAGAGRASWGATLDAKLTDEFSLGLGYLADLADSEAHFLEESGNRYSRRVGALTGYIQARQTPLEISLEAVGALHGFAELEPGRNRPRAWNLEVAYQTEAEWSWALRYEASQDLDDQPARRWGVALTWRIDNEATLGIEALAGRYRLPAEFDAEAPSRYRRVAMQWTLPF